MKKTIKTATLAFLIIAAILAPAWADTTARVTATLRVIRGPLSIGASDISFSSVNLGSGEKSAEGANVLNVMDPTGSGQGWNVTARVSDFVSDSGSVLSADQLGFTLNGSTLLSSSGSGTPELSGQPVKLDGTDRKIVTAQEGQAAGSFSILNSYQVNVPADAPQGTYSGQVAYTITTGP